MTSNYETRSLKPAHKSAADLRSSNIQNFSIISVFIYHQPKHVPSHYNPQPKQTGQSRLALVRALVLIPQNSLNIRRKSTYTEPHFRSQAQTSDHSFLTAKHFVILNCPGPRSFYYYYRHERASQNDM